ncbi:hypothetical protein CEXT_391 [Caerostris extrusa]|uniref:Uncharacterized protein n=1 Tax=Caerostris extrusa TaxID=172846 RepID=A0AAV4SKL0_CAEEX|nr:hypothetical protein CEXT_391 [Caerostris extrusa]
MSDGDALCLDCVRREERDDAPHLATSFRPVGAKRIFFGSGTSPVPRAIPAGIGRGTLVMDSYGLVRGCREHVSRIPDERTPCRGVP